MEIAVVALSVLALVAVLSIGYLRSRRTDGPQAGESRLAPLPVQLLFVGRTDRALSLDCIVMQDVDVDGILIRSGTPATLQLRRPSNPVLREWAEAMLTGWTDEGAVVDLAVITGGPIPQVSLRAGRSKLQLPVEHALGAA